MFTRFIAASAVTFMLCSLARGDDFLLSGAGARTAGTGGAWIPSSTSALGAMAVNPAGLALLSGPVLDFGAYGAFATGQLLNSANTNGKLSSAGVVPLGAFATPLGTSRLTIGIAVLPQLLSAANWRYTDPPGGAGGVSYGSLSNKSDITVLRTAAGIGLNLGPRLQIGATAGAVYNSNTLETAYVFQTNPALGGLKTLLDLHTNGIGWNTSVGALVHVSKKAEFGVSYKSITKVRSTGDATGNAGIQFAAIGLGAARPDFRYDAEVDNVFPQQVTTNIVWSQNDRLRFVAQGEWVNWNRAFTSLPVILTNGNNADINSLLQTSGIKDSIPLEWKDQFVERVGIERNWLESATLRAGYAHQNDPVPSSTLLPLTAAITRDTLTAGFGLQLGRGHIDISYAIDPTVHQSVARAPSSPVNSAVAGSA